MRHYPLWLEKYSRRRDQILNELKKHKDTINEIHEKIRDKDIILPIKKTTMSKKASFCFVDGGEVPYGAGV